MTEERYEAIRTRVAQDRRSICEIARTLGCSRRTVLECEAANPTLMAQGLLRIGRGRLRLIGGRQSPTCGLGDP